MTPCVLHSWINQLKCFELEVIMLTRGDLGITHLTVDSRATLTSDGAFQEHCLPGI
jgi:hypothetical protein